MSQLGQSELGGGGILCCVSGTVDRHVRLNFGRSMINTVAVTHNFPLSGDFCPLKSWRSGPSWGDILCGVSDTMDPHIPVNCGLCDKYVGRDAQVSLSGGYAPKGGKRPELRVIMCGVSATNDRHVRVNFGSCTINTVDVTHKLPHFGEVLTPLLGMLCPLLGHFIAPMDLHICVNFGQSGTKQWLAYANFSLSGSLCPQKGEAARVGGLIVRRRWYNGPTCSGEF